MSLVEHSFLQSSAHFNAFEQRKLRNHPGYGLPNSWLILDTGSTANIISNKSLLRGIHMVKKVLRVRCNAGVAELNQMGYLGSHPEPVWYNPNGIANILLLHRMNKLYKVDYFNGKEDRFEIQTNKRRITFVPTDKGLYHFDLKADTDKRKQDASLILTVKNQKANHTKAAVMRAAQARLIQNIIGRPGDHQYLYIVNTNWLADCPVTPEDIKVADNIYGPNLGSLKGKTVARTDGHVRTTIGDLPSHVIELYSSVTIAVDIMFINKVPFFVTISRNVKFGTVERIPNRQVSTIKGCVKRVIKIYARRNFKVNCILGDPEFEPLQAEFPSTQVDCCGADEHVPEIERFIRTIKDRTRSTYNMLPFRRIPVIILEHMVRNAVFWLNAFPAQDGISNSTLSPKYIVTGRQITMKRHVRLEFGSYVQTHEEHTNDMRARTLGAICLGPTNSAQGTHFFMSLATGRRIARQHWTPLPMPNDVIQRVSQMGAQQGMPATLTFADRHGKELVDESEDIDDNHDSEFDPNEDNSTRNDADDDVSYASDASEISQHNALDQQPGYAAAATPAGVNAINQAHQPQFPNKNTNINQQQPPPAPMSLNNTNRNPEVDGGNAGVDGDNPGLYGGNSGVEAGIPGVEASNPIIPSHDDDSTQTSEDDNPTQPDNDHDDEYENDNEPGNEQDIDDITQEMEQDLQEGEHLLAPPKQQAADNQQAQVDQIMDNRYGPQNHDRNLRPRKIPKTHGPAASSQEHQLHISVPHWDTYVPEFEELVALFHNEVTFVMEQMSAKKGLEVFGQKGAEAIVAEMHQIHYRKVLDPKYAYKLTKEQRKNALRYLMFLKEKRDGKVKGRGVADGRKQRLYKSKDETSAPTVRTESFMITCAIDAKEGRKVMTIDIPGAFMQADTDEEIHVKFEGKVAELLTKVDPELYSKYIAYEGKKPVIYCKLNKNLYGTLQGAICWWKNLSEFLINEMGFKVNPYDSCVVNKMIKGKQCTVIWHVDDLKVSHMEQQVLEEFAERLSERYGQEAPLTIQRGDVHEYLGITVDFSKKGRVKFSMDDYVEDILNKAPDDMKGEATSPAANHLFNVNKDPKLLDPKKADLFHHMTAKLLYLCKRVRGNLMTTVAFLTTRVSKPDHDDYLKLARCIKYLRKTKNIPSIIEMSDNINMEWWIDASFAVHPDMKSHTGGCLTMGVGAIIGLSTKQKINTDSSTVAELVGVHDAMPFIIWARYFITAQGYPVKDTIVHQDNQSAILLGRNGRMSAGRRTRHLDIRYFSVTDKIKQRLMRLQYCPTDKMLGDFYTKPLQGAKFRGFRNQVQGIEGTEYALIDSPSPQECVGADAKTGTRDSTVTSHALPRSFVDEERNNLI